MYDQLRSEYESMKRSAIQPANNFYSRAEPDLFSNPPNMMDNREPIRKGKITLLTVLESSSRQSSKDQSAFHPICGVPRAKWQSSNCLVVAENFSYSTVCETKNSFVSISSSFLSRNDFQECERDFFFLSKTVKHTSLFGGSYILQRNASLTYLLQNGRFSLLKLQAQERTYGHKQDRIVRTLALLTSLVAHLLNNQPLHLMLVTEDLLPVDPYLDLEPVTHQWLWGT